MILSNQGLQPDPFATNLGHLGGLITGFFIGFLITLIIIILLNKDVNL